eukprot:TRINITY_DN44599_c0_g1_i1.p1 TRINITY_DN44599_c0_g1~~TRINITY_DN44599_c0_g1_i1.p1  ORF type:complete len:312 (-),score=74.99 TRINITY_DN44599_c0_g1_i1:48-983(-)
MGSVVGRFCQGCYALAMVLTMSSAALGMKALYLLPVDKMSREGWSLIIMKFWWQMSFVLAPWVWTTDGNESAGEWKAMMDKMDALDAEAKASTGNEKRKPLFLLSNHTSFLDSVLFCAKTPFRPLFRFRAYMDVHLYKLPILGTIAHAIGHFPVYFKSSQDGVYSVDTAKMELVDKDVNTHIENGGWLSFYPEGAINKEPDTLLPFRFGGMKKALDFDARLISFVAVGNQNTWPKKAKVGGLPCRIRYSTKILAADGAKAFIADLRKKDLPKEDQELADPALLAKYLRAMMQEQYDVLKQELYGTAAVKSD